MATLFTGTTKAKSYNNRTNIFEVKKYIKRFNINELETKHEAQRALDEDWVQEIIRNWDERTCTPPVVVIEKDKKLVVDGQHRLQAMKELNYSQVECYLIEGISASEAFLMINNIKPIENIDKFIQKSKTSSYENQIVEIFNSYEVEISTYSLNSNYFTDVDFLWELESDFNDKALKAALDIIVNIVEYEGKLSKSLVSKLYNIFNEDPELYSKAHKEMITLKSLYTYESNSNARKTICKMQKRFPKSKIDIEIKNMIYNKC